MKHFFLVGLWLLISANLWAQTYQYHLFPNQTAEWKYEILDEQGDHVDWFVESFVADFDTMHSDLGSYYEENKRIYYRYGGVGPYHCRLDFNLTVGDSMLINPTENDFLYVISDDSTSSTFGGRRVLEIDNYLNLNTTYWVEGIGNVSSLFHVFDPLNMGAISWENHLRCMIADGQPIIDQNCGAVTIQEPDSELISIYPNPTSGVLTIDHDFMEIRIFDYLGKELLIAANSTRTKQLDLSHLPEGLYFCYLVLPDFKTVTSTVVKL